MRHVSCQAHPHEVHSQVRHRPHRNDVPRRLCCLTERESMRRNCVGHHRSRAMSSTDLTECAIPSPPPVPPGPHPNGNMFSTRVCSLAAPNETSRLKLIEEACNQSWKLFGLSSPDQAFTILSLYHHCDSVIQSGPTCGLVALMVCLKLVKPTMETDLSNVLSEAQSLGFTKFGEMFSADNMAQFIQQVFSTRAEKRHWLEKSKLDVIEHLCQGNPLLVPYDADSNYEPCLKEGKRAHWATICGFCIVPNSENYSIQISHSDLCKEIPFTDNQSLFHLDVKSENAKTVFSLVKGILSKGKLFVYARQGKSRRIQIWNFDQLCRSNRNLSKVSSKILNDPERVQMVYPQNGDLSKSLANQFILIYK